MTAISVLPGGKTLFRAVRGTDSSTGATVGQAIDALLTDGSHSSETTLIFVQPMAADSYFSADQQKRLVDLMAEWRTARDSGTTLKPDKQAELDRLVREETAAAQKRMTDVARQIRP